LPVHPDFREDSHGAGTSLNEMAKAVRQVDKRREWTFWTIEKDAQRWSWRR